jgi:hypothetical protein
MLTEIILIIFGLITTGFLWSINKNLDEHRYRFIEFFQLFNLIFNNENFLDASRNSDSSDLAKKIAKQTEGIRKELTILRQENKELKKQTAKIIIK